MKKLQLKSITSDFSINILSSLVYTAARQLVLFPILAAKLPADQYGEVLTITGIANIIVSLLGNSLNNIRLVQNAVYEERGTKGDFNLLCLIASSISVVGVVGLSFIFALPPLTMFLLISYTAIAVLREYYIAFYRLNLNFKGILFSNCCMAVAYTILSFLFTTILLWPAVFIGAELLGLICVFKSRSFVHEPFKKTGLFGSTLSKYVVFMLSSAIGSTLTYADRLLIYPVLGSENVSVFSVSSFFGKSAGMVLLPISGVLLGYFSQRGFSPSKKLFTFINIITLGLLGVFLICCQFIAPPITSLFYPTLAQEALPFTVLANLGAVISIAGNMSQTMVLRFCNIRWVLVIQVLYAAAYLVFSLWLMPQHGLLGFCWSVVFANTIRLIAIYIAGYLPNAFKTPTTVLEK